MTDTPNQATPKQASEADDVRTLDNATQAIIAALSDSHLIDTVDLETRTPGAGNDTDRIAVTGHLLAHPDVKFSVNLDVS